MANSRFNKQVSPKGYQAGGKVKKNGWRNDAETYDGETYDEKRWTS